MVAGNGDIEEDEAALSRAATKQSRSNTTSSEKSNDEVQIKD
jgi:hypothetical protein